MSKFKNSYFNFLKIMHIMFDIKYQDVSFNVTE